MPKIHVNLIADEHYPLMKDVERKTKRELKEKPTKEAKWLMEYTQKHIKKQEYGLEYRKKTMEKEKCDAVLVELIPNAVKELLKDLLNEKKRYPDMLKGKPELEVAQKRKIPIIPIEREKEDYEFDEADAEHYALFVKKRRGEPITEKQINKVKKRIEKLAKKREAYHSKMIIQIGKKIAKEKGRPARLRVILGEAHITPVKRRIETKMGKGIRVEVKNLEYQRTRGKPVLRR